MTKIQQISIWIVCFCVIFLPNVKAQLTLDNIFLDYGYTSKQLDAIEFYNQKEAYAQLQQQTIISYDSYGKIQTQFNTQELWSQLGLPVQSIANFSISNSDAYFLLGTNSESQYRRSNSAQYFISNGKTLQQISDAKLFFPTFSHDDSKIAYVKDNNIYYTDIKKKAETAVTTDGRWNAIINGKSDWVYEEEWELTRCFKWNNTGTKIAYLKFDESAVKEYSIPMHYQQNYPTIFTYKYPKVDEANSKVSVWYYDLKKKKNYRVPINFDYEYIPRVYWHQNYIVYLLFNRLQNNLKVVAYNTQTKQTSIWYEENSTTYIELPQLIFLDANSFLITSEKDGYNHIYYYNTEGKQITQITKGNFEIQHINAIDLKQNLIYFETNRERIAERQIYTVNYKTLALNAFLNEPGTNSVDFAPQLTYYIHTLNADTIPHLVKILHSNQTSITVLEDNKLLKGKLSVLPQKKFATIAINDYEVECWYIQPANFDSTKRYPLLMYVYGGPGNQEVVNEYGGTTDKWLQFMAQNGCYVICVDNRGSGGKGAAFKKCTYTNLGRLEVDDQITVAEYYASLPYIDSTRIGIFGWSYGGFMSLLCLEKGNHIFKTAVSVAPVTKWQWYDNVYTERFMQTTELNKSGYDTFNPIALAEQLKGNLLLVHGTADDNVHVQHSYALMTRLNALNIPYQSYIYPDKNHGISGGTTRYNLFKKITAYLMNNL